MQILEDRSTALDAILIGICETLQLTRTQYELAEGRYEDLGKYLNRCAHPYLPQPQVYSQGSFRIGTTVRPVGRSEYDLDAVCELALDWRLLTDPVLVLNALEAVLRMSPAYSGRIERKNRCIRLVYANEFHIDLLPACPDPASGLHAVVVPDRSVHAWKPSNPKGYAIWFDLKTIVLLKVAEGRALAGLEPLPGHESARQKKPLQRVVQLLKRWRDIYYRDCPDLAPISIVLTTLAAEEYRGQASESEALTGIINGIVARIPTRGRLVVLNPVNLKEDLSERWDNPKVYQAFVRGMLDLQRDWNAILAGEGLDTIGAGMEDVFGSDPVKESFRRYAASVSSARKKSSLGVRPATGILSTCAASTLPVRPNTFHGDEE